MEKVKAKARKIRRKVKEKAEVEASHQVEVKVEEQRSLVAEDNDRAGQESATSLKEQKMAVKKRVNGMKRKKKLGQKKNTGVMIGTSPATMAMTSS